MWYINKPVEIDTGAVCSCWIAGRGGFDLFASTAFITLAGWADAAERTAGAKALANTDEAVLMDMVPSLPSLVAELAGLLVGPGGPLEGGTVADGAVTLAADGFQAAYWRPTRGKFNLVDGTGILSINGWISEAAFNAGKAPAGEKCQKLKLADLSSMPAVWRDVAGLLITYDASRFKGGELLEL